MATSSITHNFVLSSTESVKRFIRAIEEAEIDRTPSKKVPGRQLTDSNEILALMAKRKNFLVLPILMLSIFYYITQ